MTFPLSPAKPFKVTPHGGSTPETRPVFTLVRSLGQFVSGLTRTMHVALVENRAGRRFLELREDVESADGHVRTFTMRVPHDRLADLRAHIARALVDEDVNV